MLHANQLIGFGAQSDGIRVGASGFATIATSVTTQTFTSQNIGDPAPDRYVIVGVFASDGAAAFGVNSLTVNGVSAVEAVDYPTAPRNNGIALYIALVPTGTSVSIAVTFSEAVQFGCAIAFMSVYGLTTTTAHAAGSVTEEITTTDNISCTLNTVSNGLWVSLFVIGLIDCTATWSGGGVSIQTNNRGANYCLILGYMIGPDAATPATITATANTTDNYRLITAAMFV